MKSYAFLLCLHVAAFSISAQEPLPLPDKPGTWTYAYLDDGNTKMYSQQFGMTPGEISLFRNKLDHLVDILHRNPVLANPKGIDPTVESRPLYPHGFKNHPQNYGYIGEVNFRLCQWFNDAGKIYKQTIEPPRVSFYINQIVPLIESAFNVAGPEDAEVKKAEILVNQICKPDKIRDLGSGVTLYDAAIVFGDPGKSLYLPCSVGEAYKRLIAYYELAAKKEPVFGVILTGIKQEFKGITASQLNGPAYFGGMFSGITPVRNDAPLYLFNNNYFDRSKPKTDIQLIVFPIDADYFRKESDFAANSVGFLRIHQFLNTLDVAALSGFIE